MKRVFLLATLMMAMTMPVLSFAQSPITAEIAPTGKLRVALNAGTAVLLTRASDGTITGGVAPALAKFFSGKFGTVVELVAYPNSDTYTQTFGKGEWDIGLGPKTPLTAEKADFLADVLLNEFWFIAAPGREFANDAQVDRPGVKIGVGLNSSSDQFLSKTLKSAQLVRGVTSVDALRSGQVDVWAASASNIQEVAKRVSGARIVSGAFRNDQTMVILPKGRSSAAQARVVQIINEAKKTGLVQKAIDQTGVKGVRAAPLNKVS
jgi:polar amino acid transport system substrate-binding protein